MATVERPPMNVDPDAPIVHQGLPFWVGIGPGLVAGATMLVILCILSLARENGLWAPIHVIASVFMGPQALAGGPWPTIVGLLLHFGISAVLGGVFAMVVGETTKRRQLGLGLAYGVLIWLVVQFAFLPLVAPYIATHIGTVFTFFLGHFGFGLMLGASLPGISDIDAPRRAYIDPLRREVRP